MLSTLCSFYLLGVFHVLEKLINKDKSKNVMWVKKIPQVFSPQFQKKSECPLKSACISSTLRQHSGVKCHHKLFTKRAKCDLRLSSLQSDSLTVTSFHFLFLNLLTLNPWKHRKSWKSQSLKGSCLKTPSDATVCELWIALECWFSIQITLTEGFCAVRWISECDSCFKSVFWPTPGPSTTCHGPDEASG